jgi:outer membrane protein assembly factor BamD
LAGVFRTASIGVVVALLAGVGACARPRPLPPPGAVDADKFLFSRGTEALTERRWTEAREYFRRLVDTYPQSPFRYDAKLAIGDSFLGDGDVQSDIMAANEFREFLTFYPLHERADYAQFRLAISQQRQMLSPQRDQTATHEALKEFDNFLQRFPDSPLADEARELRRDVRDRLSRHEFEVGLSYYRLKWWPGAQLRFKDLLEADPNYTGRHEVIFYLAETYFKSNRPMDALPLYEQLVATYANSPHADDARKRIEEIKR